MMSSIKIMFFYIIRRNFMKEVSLENLEAQASITVYLFSFNSGRVARRSGPLLFCARVFEAHEKRWESRFVCKKSNRLVTFSREVALKNPEAQASITVYLFSFNSGRVARRSGPFFCPMAKATTDSGLVAAQGVVDEQRNQRRLVHVCDLGLLRNDALLAEPGHGVDLNHVVRSPTSIIMSTLAMPRSNARCDKRLWLAAAGPRHRGRRGWRG